MSDRPNDQPAPPCEGYLRVAVAQIETHAAALLGGLDLLEHPTGQNEKLFPIGFNTKYRSEVQQLRARIKGEYLAQLESRLQTIVATCQRWGVQVLAFPEYSIPPELLEGLLPASQSMVIIAGSHGVAPDNGALYERLGGTLEPGLNVAPVLYGGRVAGWVAKEQPALAEVGQITPGLNGGPVELPGFVIPRIWVRICLDYLVNPSTDDDVALTIVIARTSEHSASTDFASLATREAERLRRPVLLASDPRGGGSGIFVATKSEGLPTLPAKVEGLWTADILNAPSRPGETGAYHKPQLVIPVAEASVVYAATVAGQAYTTALAKKPTTLGKATQTWAAETLELPHTKHPSVQRRLDELADGTFANPEDIARRTRELVMPPTVLPIQALQSALAKGVVAFIGDRRAGFQAELGALETQLETAVASGLKAALIPAAQTLADQISEAVASDVAPPEPTRDNGETVRETLERALAVPMSEARTLLAPIDPTQLDTPNQVLWALASINSESDDARVEAITTGLPREQQDIVDVFRALLREGNPVPDELPMNPHVRVLAAKRLVQSGDQERAVELAEALLLEPGLSARHKVDAFLAATLALHATIYEYPSLTRPVPVAARARLIPILDAERVKLDADVNMRQRFFGPRSIYIHLVEDREARRLELEGEPETLVESNNKLTSDWGRELAKLGALPSPSKLAELVKAYPGREPLESRLAESLLASGRGEDAVSHAELAFELLPGIGKALRLARTLARRRPLEAYRVLKQFDDRDSELINLFCADLDEQLGRPTDAMKRLEAYLSKHPDSVRAQVWCGRLRYRLEGGSKGPNDAWEAVSASLKNLRPEILRRVAEIQGPPLSKAIRTQRLEDIAAALRSQRGVEAEACRLQIQDALRASTVSPSIDPHLIEVDPRPLVEAGMLIEMTFPMLQSAFERLQQRDLALAAGYQQGYIGFEAWITDTGREPQALANELLTTQRWRWPILGQVGENTSAEVVLLGLAELVVLDYLSLLDLVTRSSTKLVVFHDVFNRLTHGNASEREELGTWLIDLQRQGRLDVRPRPTLPPWSQAIREEHSLLETPLSYFEELRAAAEADAALIHVTADFGTGNLFAVPNSAAAVLRRQLPDVDWAPYVELRDERLWPLAQWLEKLGAGPPTLRKLVSLGSFNAITTKLLAEASSQQNVRVLLEPLFKNLGAIPRLAPEHLALAVGLWLSSVLGPLITSPELNVSRDELITGTLASLRVLKGSQASFGYWFGIRLVQELATAGHSHGLEDLAEAIGRELATNLQEKESFYIAVIDGLSISLEEGRERFGMLGARLAAIVLATLVGPTEGAIGNMLLLPGLLEASVLTRLTGEPCEFVDDPPLDRLLRDAIEVLSTEPTSEKRLLHYGIQAIVNFDGRRVSIAIAPEALILGCRDTEVRRFALRFANDVGRHDEDAARLARELADDPKDAAIRWAFAMRALRAPWRRIRRWPAYALEWLSPADAGRMAMTRDELRALLGEKRTITGPLGTEVAARFAEGGVYAERGDALQVLGDMTCLPLSREVNQMTDLILARVPTDPIAQDALSDLLIHRNVRSAQLNWAIVLLSAIADKQPTVSLDGITHPIRETMLAKLNEMLADEQKPDVVDFTTFEPALGLVSAWIVAVIDKQDSGGPTLDLINGRWLTLRLFDWLCRQMVALPHREISVLLGPILAKARELSKLSPLTDDALDPRAWGPLDEDQRLNLRLANTLFAMQMQMSREHRTTASEHMLWSPTIEERLVALASRPLTPIERQIRHSSSREGSLSRELAVSPMVTVPDLAITNLMMMRPEAFARLSPEVRLRWIDDLPRSSEDKEHAPHLMLFYLLNGLVHTTDHLAINELSELRKLVESWLEKGVRDWWLLPAMLAVGIRPTVDGDAERLLELLKQPEASTFISDYVSLLAEDGPDTLEHELRALMALGDIDTGYLLLRALSPLLLRSENPNHATASAVMKRLIQDPRLAGDARIRLLLTNLGWKP